MTVEGVAGETGATGGSGAQGIQGPTGAAGNAGLDGADGIFTQIASKVEAEAGVENTKGMTALRTAEAIQVQVSTHTSVNNNTGNIAINAAAIVDHEGRILNLEQLVDIQVGSFSGSQQLKNNSGPIELLGHEAPILEYGKGVKFGRSKNNSEFISIMVYIRRKTTTEFRFTSFTALLHYIEGDKWYLQRDETNLLKESLDVDGVTLSVVTDGTGTAQVSYTTDNMAGADHDLVVTSKPASVIKWLAQEISAFI